MYFMTHNTHQHVQKIWCGMKVESASMNEVCDLIFAGTRLKATNIQHQPRKCYCVIGEKLDPQDKMITPKAVTMDEGSIFCVPNKRFTTC